MNIVTIAKRLGKVASDNSPAILTAIGVAGTVMTALSTAKASFKAGEMLHDHILARKEAEQLPEGEGVWVSNREIFDLTWKLYVPAVGTGIMTIACIVAANRIGTRRTAALASAYAVSQETFKEYKSKVIEHLGKDKEQKVRDEITRDRVEKNPPPQIINAGKTCQVHDEYTGRWFTSSMDALKQAEIDINFQIINEGHATLSDFWRLLGVTHAAICDEIGWNTERKLELDIGSTIEDSIPIFTLDFRTIPVRGYGSSY
jgi:hypothetical protein